MSQATPLTGSEIAITWPVSQFGQTFARQAPTYLAVLPSTAYDALAESHIADCVAVSPVRFLGDGLGSGGGGGGKGDSDGLGAGSGGGGRGDGDNDNVA